ncbi:MAG: ABC transporter substrate-binding protein [Thermodesulfovibrionales bacterium]|nr:ABC transporter substrate-binding protein [Thermodesulfovibrionales bacterium]
MRYMEERGLRVVGIYPESLSELYDVMRLHGKVFNREHKIEKAISEMEKIFSIIKHKTTSIPANNKRKVLWIGSKQTSVAGRIGITNDIFTMIGGRNVASHILQRNAEVSIEQIIAWNPDVIFIWGNAKYDRHDILNNPQWRHIKAVREGRVFKSPQWSTWSPRIAPIALWMAKKTYPEYYADVDLEKILESFYRKVYGVSYSKVRQIDN